MYLKIKGGRNIMFTFTIVVYMENVYIIIIIIK